MTDAASSHCCATVMSASPSDACRYSDAIGVWANQKTAFSSRRAALVVVPGSGGGRPGDVSSLPHHTDAGATNAFQIHTDVGILDDSTDLVPALEAALANVPISGAER